VHQIENSLIVGVSMGRGHQATLDAEGVVQHFGHRRETIGRARCVGHDVMLTRVIVLIVDAEHQCDVFVGCGAVMIT